MIIGLLFNDLFMYIQVWCMFLYFCVHYLYYVVPSTHLNIIRGVITKFIVWLWDINQKFYCFLRPCRFPLRNCVIIFARIHRDQQYLPGVIYKVG